MNPETTAAVQLSESDVEMLLAAIEHLMKNDCTLADDQRNELDNLHQRLDRR